MHLLLFCLQSGRFYHPDIGFWGELSWFLGRDVSEFLMEAVRKCGDGPYQNPVVTHSDRGWQKHGTQETNTHITLPYWSTTDASPSLPAQTCSLSASLHLPLLSWSREISIVSICRSYLCCFTPFMKDLA